MEIRASDFEEIYLCDDGVGQEIAGRTSAGLYQGQYTTWLDSEPTSRQTLAKRLCGNVFILTDVGESEVVRLRQALPQCSFIYPQIRFEHYSDDPYYTTPYEIDANRAAPFRMIIGHATDEFRKVLAPYILDNNRSFYIDADVFMLMKMRF